MTCLPKSDHKMGCIIGHRIDYNGVGARRGQRQIPSKNSPKYSPPHQGGGVRSILCWSHYLVPLPTHKMPSGALFFANCQSVIYFSVCTKSTDSTLIAAVKGVKGVLRHTRSSVFNFRERWKHQIKFRELWMVYLSWYVSFKIFYLILVIFDN